MDVYAARTFAAFFSVSLILTAAIVLFTQQNGRQRDGHQTTTKNDEGDKLSETLLFKTLNNRKDNVFKLGPHKGLSLGEKAYYSSDIYTYLRAKTTEELELAGAQRKTECGTFLKYSAIDCDICILFVNGLRALVEQGSTQEDVAVFATRVCKDLRIEDDRVCDAITQEYKVI